MKHLLQYFLFIFLFSGGTVFAQERFCKENFCSHHAAAHGFHYDFSNYTSSRELTGDYDAIYHRLEFQVDPAILYINGTVTTYFESKEDGFSDLFFDLSDSLTVNDVQYHGTSVAFSQPGDHLLEITLPAALNAATLDSVTIIYEGKPYSTDGSFQVGAHGIDLTPVMWTLSEPYGSRDWWPCKHDLTDKIDSVDIIVTAPEVYRSASNGSLVKEEIIGTDRVMTWKHRYKIPAYLVAFAVTDYVTFTDYVHLESGDSIMIMHMAYPEKVIAWEDKLDETMLYMQYFSETFGIYPFHLEKYGHANFGWGGGMEHQTMSFMGGASKLLIAHELAHQWFGDKVTCGSWEDLWLNESFATYLTELTIETFESEEDWQTHKENYNTSVTFLGDGSVYIPDTTSVARMFNFRLTYQKGSIVLRMLRWKIGDEAFFQGCYNYINDPNLAYGYARTPDFIAHMEAASGEDLTEFFADWFYGEGYPAYTINAFQDGGELRLTAYQGTSHPSVDFYEMPIPIYCAGNGVDTTYRLDHTENGQEWTVDIPFKIDSISFDPTYYLLSGNNTVDFNFKQNFIDIFPNPTTDVIQLNSSNLITQVLIFSSDGSIVYESSDEHISSTISLETFAVGTYVVKVTSEINEEVFKVVKQ